MNEYIVLRYGSRTLKNFGSLTLIIAAFLYMGIVLYSPSLALSTMTGLSPTVSIAIMGLICTFYITIGGVKAVVYTDVVQSFIMVLGLVLTAVFSIVDLGGVGNVFYKAEEGGRLEFFNMDPDPLVRHTFWSVQINGMVITVFMTGLSQTGHQRFSSVSTLALAQREEERGLYHLSYCYIGSVGMLIFCVVGSIVSFFTGPLNPHEIDARLISPRCLRFSKWIYNAFKHSGVQDTAENSAIPDNKLEAMHHKETANQVEPAAYTEIHL
ncbi:sodium-dependent multivitamin transporter-like [Macrobrachium rosenbergii]|uniref:sodium-dependent multivitamin transporter-like n=1 Tax=Macrobrachium rosenbergii TaxID=79674 RepID=UPI0034D512EC